jgi:hypothetical protein
VDGQCYKKGNCIYKSSVFQIAVSSRHFQQNFEPQGVQKHNEPACKDVLIHNTKSHRQWRLICLIAIFTNNSVAEWSLENESEKKTEIPAAEITLKRNKIRSKNKNR